MAKAEHLLLAVLDALNELGDVLHIANALQHAQHRLISSSMQRAVQRTNSPCTPTTAELAGAVGQTEQWLTACRTCSFAAA